MFRSCRRRGSWVLARVLCGCPFLLVSLLAIPDGEAGGSADRRDQMFVHAEIAELAPGEIAVLPAVDWVDDATALETVERMWCDAYSGTDHEWISSAEVRARLTRDATDAGPILRVMAAEVRRNGRLSPRTAAEVARRLAVGAVLILRVDRWEVVSGRAQVELRAALMDSTGRVLWTMAGLAGHGGSGPAPRLDRNVRTITVSRPQPHSNLEPYAPVLIERPLEDVRATLVGPGGAVHGALAELLARWRPALPSPAQRLKSPVGEPVIAASNGSTQP